MRRNEQLLSHGKQEFDSEIVLVMPRFFVSREP
jgi:hypothetical protein